jgi:hypothetical protein
VAAHFADRRMSGEFAKLLLEAGTYFAAHARDEFVTFQNVQVRQRRCRRRGMAAVGKPWAK